MDKKIRFRKGLYRSFLGVDIFFGVLTLIFLFAFPPIGLVGMPLKQRISSGCMVVRIM